MCSCDFSTGECQAPNGCKAVAEAAHLRAALRVARRHVAATNDAEHMMDGFGGWRERASDVDLSMVDDVLNQNGEE